MITIVFFTVSLLAIISFVLFIFFKMMTSIVYALFSSGGIILLLGVLGTVGSIVLFLLYAFVNSIVTSGLKESLLTLAMLVISLVLLVVIAGGVFFGLGGGFVLEIVLRILETVCFVILSVLMYGTRIFGIAYIQCIGIITDKLRKC